MNREIKYASDAAVAEASKQVETAYAPVFGKLAESERLEKAQSNRIIKTTRYEQERGGVSVTLNGSPETATEVTVDDGHGVSATYRFTGHHRGRLAWFSDCPMHPDEESYPSLVDLGRYFLGEGFEL